MEYIEGEPTVQSAEEVCGLSTKHQWRKQTWWWNDLVNSAVVEKRRCYREWKAGGSREAYNAAKRIARRAVYHAKNVGVTLWGLLEIRGHSDFLG